MMDTIANAGWKERSSPPTDAGSLAAGDKSSQRQAIIVGANVVGAGGENLMAAEIKLIKPTA